MTTRNDEDQIRDLIGSASDAQDDPATLPALHTADAVVVNVAGRRVLGRDAFATAMAAALQTSLRAVRTYVEIVDVRFVTDDVAIANCVKTIHDDRSDGGPLPSAGALTYVLARVEEAWAIALAQTTPIAS